MNMSEIKYNVIYSNYDKDTGVSLVEIQTKHGSYRGVSKLNPEDAPYASEFTGCTIAEIRAYRNSLVARRRIAQYELRTLMRLSQTLQGMTGYNHDSKESSKIRRFIYDTENDIQWYTKLIDSSCESEKAYLDMKKDSYERFEKKNAESDKTC